MSIQKPSPTESKFQSIIKEITQPFIDLTKTSKAMLGVNIAYLVEGITYFGIIGLLALFFNDFVGLDDINAGWMLGLLTAGITISMLVLGATVDMIGIRKSLLVSLVFILIGRIILTLSPTFGDPGLWNSAQMISLLGIFGIVIGYGIYQPASYAAVKKLNTAKNAAMGYAMLYALMNLGAFLPAIMSPPIRKAYGIDGAIWVFTGLTIIGIIAIALLVTKKAIAQAQAKVKEVDGDSVEEDSESNKFSAYINLFFDKIKENPKRLKFLILSFTSLLFLIIFKNNLLDLIVSNFDLNISLSMLYNVKWYILMFFLIMIYIILLITDNRFSFFIFILIPVQTLFAHNWLTLPQYTSRAFDGIVGENFESFVNLNPLLIFILTPIVTALTLKQSTYKMMIIGTMIMAFPTFILAMGPSLYTLMAYLIIMTIGEALWQPRFLQWVAEIAPKGMTGIYMGIGQFPWFLTKIVTALYSGWFLQNYCPSDTPKTDLNTETMWLIYGFIAIITPIGLLLARKWMVKGFK